MTFHVTLMILAIAVIAVAGLTGVALVLVQTYRRFRGKRLVTCPETQAPAAVDIDAGHAAITSVLGTLDLHLSACSRWPERRDCGQACLSQIESAPEACLVRTILEAWYAGKTCAACGKPFAGIQSGGHQVALRGPAGGTIEWGEVPSERLPEMFATHEPICWSCHVAEKFRRLRPELVTDRDRSEERPARHPITA